jgi:caa(3)-type oxidase subunit IV
MSELHHPNYVKIWAVLLVLLAISIAGPLLGHPLLTLMTAFGIAIVKAYLVAKNFMHLDIERRFAVYLLTTVLVFVLLFFAGAAPDVMKHEGDNWVKPPVGASVADHAGHG